MAYVQGNLFEVWKAIPGFEGFYEASTFGRIRSLPRNGTIKLKRILRQRPDKYGYLKVKLRRLGQQRNITAHSLVALAFIGPRPDGNEINHKDTNKKNNQYQNLEYCTQQENTDHAVAHGLIHRGEQIHNSIFSEKDIRIIRQRCTNGETQASIAYDYNCTPAAINLIVRRINWRHVK